MHFLPVAVQLGEGGMPESVVVRKVGVCLPPAVVFALARLGLELASSKLALHGASLCPVSRRIGVITSGSALSGLC